MPTAAAAASPASTYGEIPIKLIQESSTNPRRSYDDKDLAELADNIRSVGLLQPVLVRPMKGKGFELVFGSRRLRAAKLAGLDTLPARVEELTDLQVLEIQVTENANRADVHPLEEADAYRRLHEEHGKTVQEIADRIGKSAAHVYGRLKLCTLKTAARALFLAGKLTPTTALLVARIPDEKLQTRAAKEITSEDRYAEQPMSASQAAQHVREHYMLRIDQATFDPDDVLLVPGAGPCRACPKRTGNQAELFADVKSDDVCTDPVCYEKKSIATFKVTAAEAKKKGVKVLTDAEVKKLWPHEANPEHMQYNAEYQDLGESVYDYARRKTQTVRQIVGKTPEGLAIARRPDGKVVHLVPRKVVEKAQRAAQPKPKPKTEKEKAEAAKEKAADRLKERGELVLWSSITHAVAADAAIAEPLLPIMLRTLCDDYRANDVAERHHFANASEMAEAVTAKGVPPEVQLALVVEMILSTHEIEFAFHGDPDTAELLKVLGIKRADVEKEAKRQLAKEAEDKKAGRPVKCRACGCTEAHACFGGCGWAEEADGGATDLCTRCLKKDEQKGAKKPKK